MSQSSSEPLTTPATAALTKVNFTVTRDLRVILTDT